MTHRGPFQPLPCWDSAILRGKGNHRDAWEHDKIQRLWPRISLPVWKMALVRLRGERVLHSGKTKGCLVPEASHPAHRGFSLPFEIRTGY